MGSLQLLAIAAEQCIWLWRLTAKLFHQIAPSTGCSVSRQRNEGCLGFLLQMKTITPELRCPGLQRVLVVQATAKLLLSDGEGLGVVAGLNLRAQGRTEALQALERLLRGKIEVLLQAGCFPAHERG